MDGPVLYANARWIGPCHPANFEQGRRGFSVNLIVAHHTACPLEAAVATFKASPPVHSAHFIISREEDADGFAVVYQMVDTADTAYHAADLVANLRSIGVETVQNCDPVTGAKLEDFTDAQYRSWHRLATQLAADNGFALELGTTLRPHDDFTQTTCPGDLALARIITPQEDDMTPEQDALLRAIDANVSSMLHPLAEIHSVFGTAPGTTVQQLIDHLSAQIAGQSTGDPNATATIARIEAALKQA